jgi:PUA domain protein
MARKQYSKSEIKDLIERFSYVDKIVSKKSNVVEQDGIIYVDNKATLVEFERRFFPTLKVLLTSIVIPKVVVDMGAVKFVVSGADIMRPGIRSIENFSKDDFVVIVDEKNGKPLSVGKAMFSSEEMNAMTSGKVIQNIHYVGDKYWNL